MGEIFNLPDGTRAEKPDNMSFEEFQSIIARQFPPGTPVVDPTRDAPGQADEDGFLSNLASGSFGALEAGTSLVAGALAEPFAGLLGAVKTITSGPEAGEETIKGIRGLTFQPRTKSGKSQIEAVGAFFEPVGKLLQKAEKFTGDLAADVGRKTGSPTLEAFAGAFGATLPTAAMEVLGFKGAGRLARRKGLKEKKQRTNEQFKALQESAPSIEQLKEVSRGIYREIDELGATINPKAYGRMLDDLNKDLKKAGFRSRIDDKVALALEELNGKRGATMSVADVNDLRTVAKGFVDSADPKTKSLGLTITNNIDNLLDSKDALNLPEGISRTVAESYRQARKFWGQAKKSEKIQQLLRLAEDNRASFLQGVQTEFKQLIRQHTKKKGDGKYFTDDDIAVMREIVENKPGTNILKNLAKLQITRAGGGSLIPLAGPAGSALHGVITGDFTQIGGAVLFPIIGEVSNTLAVKMTKNNFKMADAVIRAGGSGREIARAYFENVPKKQRNPSDLADLLVDPNIDISKLPKTKFTDQALEILTEKRTKRGQLAVQAPIALAQTPVGEIRLEEDSGGL